MSPMDSIAVLRGTTEIYWSGIVISLGILAGFLLTLSLYTAYNRRGNAVWVMLPGAIIFSLFISRFIHWFCNTQQYHGLISAMTDFSGGGYCIAGIVPGIILSAVIVSRLSFESSENLLDAYAPGTALTVAFVRLSALFNSTCRSKITVHNQFFKRLPFASPVYDVQGNADFRFATFFVEFLIMLAVSVLFVYLYISLHNSRMRNPCGRHGNIARLFLVVFASVELVCDSTRYDASHMNFKASFLQFINKFVGFISITMLLSAIAILCVLVYYSKRTYAGRMRKIAIWGLFIVSFVTAGVSEYLVQRFSGEYLLYYSTQSAGALLMALSVFLMYFTCRDRGEEQSKEEFE